MKQQNNNIENLFREKLQNLEANPGTNAWANVQAGIGSSAAATTTATSSSWASSVIVGITITAIAVGGYFFFNREGEKKKVKAETVIENQIIQKRGQDSKNEERNTNKEESNSTIESAINTETNIEKQSKDNIVVSVQKLDKVITNEVKGETTEQTDDDWVTEKTIDEIIAVHQQFVEEQDLSNSTSEKNQSDPGISTTHSEKATPTSDLQPTSRSNKTTDDSESIVDLRLKHRKIAGQIVFPNIFSPGLDGHNDLFKITLERSIKFENIVVNILDLNGKVIKTWSEARGSWDGNYPDGSAAPAGIYRYQAVIIKDGESIPKQGSFKLIR